MNRSLRPVLYLCFFIFYGSADFVTAQEKKDDLIWKFDANEEKSSSGKSLEIVRAQEGEYIYVTQGDHGIMIFQGGIILRYGDMEIFSETVKYNPKTGEFFGEGNIKITDNDQVIYGDQFVFDNNKKVGVILNPRMDHGNLHFRGDSVTVVPNEMYVIAKSVFTGCEAKNPHYFFRASKVWISPENEVIALGVLYYVGLTPVFYLPFLLKTDVGTGVKTLYGNSNANGHYLQNTYSFGVSRKKTSILPEHMAFMFDFYQFNGWYLGTYLKRNSRYLKYDASMGTALYRFRDVLDTASGDKKITNYITLGNGTVGTKSEYWYEFNIHMNASLNRSFQKDRQSELIVIFEEYNNAAFNKNFKQRHIPTSSFDSFWINRSMPNIYKPINTTLWQASFSQTWTDASLNAVVQREKRWSRGADNSGDYSYLPGNDILPLITFQKNWQVLKPKGKIFAGARNEVTAGVGRENEYKFGSFYKTVTNYYLMDGIRFYFPLLPVVTFMPSLGVGIQGQISQYQNNAAKSNTEDGRNTYEFGFSQNTLRLGVSQAHLYARHEIQYAFHRQQTDPSFQNQLYHAATFGAVLDFAPFFYFTSSTARDLRSYPESVSEKELWLPLTTVLRFDYDFVNSTPSMYPFTHNKPYFGISLEERFDYHIRFDTPGMNVLSLFFNVGGYRFLFFPEIFYLQTGISWLHDFKNNLRNQLVYELNTEIQVAKYWKIFTELRSRFINTSPASPYADAYSAFNRDSSRIYSPFDVDQVSAGLEHNLHRWVLRLTYSVRRVWIPVGADTSTWQGFYEQGVYLTMNLSDYPALGIPETTLYEYNPRLDRDFN